MRCKTVVSRVLALALCVNFTFGFSPSVVIAEDYDNGLQVTTDLPDGAVVVESVPAPQNEPAPAPAAEPEPPKAEPAPAPAAEPEPPKAEPAPAPAVEPEPPKAEPAPAPAAEPEPPKAEPAPAPAVEPEPPKAEPAPAPAAEPEPPKAEPAPATTVESEQPTAVPTECPTTEPTQEATTEPTVVPVEATAEPTVAPSEEPTPEPTEEPKQIFTISVRFIDAETGKELANGYYTDVTEGESFGGINLPKVDGYHPTSIQNMTSGASTQNVGDSKGFTSIGNVEDAVEFVVYYEADKKVEEPTTEPTTIPTTEPTAEPSDEPTAEPTEEPTIEPSTTPDVESTTTPEAEATFEPSPEPSLEPTIPPEASGEGLEIYSMMLMLGAYDIAVNDAGDKVYAVVCDGSLLGKYTPGTQVNLTVPTKDGYDFIGWKVVCSESVSISENSFTMPSAPVGIVSQWKAQTHQVAIYYVTSSGSSLYEGKFSEVMNGSSFSLDAGYSLPSIDGYTATSIRHAGNTYTNVSEFRNIICIDSVAKDETFEVVYEPADASYTVKHYRQDLEGNYPDSLMESETFDAKYADVIEISSLVKSYTGFVWRGFVDDEATSIKLATGNNEVKIYYQRSQYRLFYVDGASTLWHDVKFEAPVNIAEKFGTPPHRTDATFVEWTTNDKTINIVNGTFTMPAHDVIFNSTWQPNATTDYHIYYYIESTASANTWTTANHRDGNGDPNPSDDMDYQFHGDVKLTGNTGDVVDQNVATTNADGIVDTAHFTFSRMDENVAINADGSTVVKVYYRRNTYWYEFRYNSNRNQIYTWNGHSQGRLYYKYEADLTEAGITGSWPYRDAGGEIQWIQSSGAAISAPTSANLGYNYTIYHNGNASNRMGFGYIKQNLSGQYAGDSEKGVLVQFFYNYDQRLSVVLRAYRCPEGFTFDKYVTDSGKSGNIPPVGSWGDNNGQPGFMIEDASTNWATIYFRRNQYKISFSNGSNVVSESNPVYYQASLPNASAANVPSIDAMGIPDAYKVGYEFAGLEDSNNSALYTGSTPTEAYEKFIATNSSMPARNILLTAKWKLKTYKVNFYDDAKMVGTSDTLMFEQVIEYGKLITSSPNEPTRDNYVFGGWYYKDSNQVEKPWIADATRVSENMNIYAKWTASEQIVADITVIHNYLDNDGNIVDTVNDTKQGVVGTIVTIEALNRAGYFPDLAVQNYEVKEEDNTVIFNYKPIEEVEYTVYYVNTNGENLINPVRKVTKNLIVTENYVYIPYCTPRVLAQELRLTSNSEDNVIIFVYDVVGKTSYTIKYWQEQLDGSYVEVAADRLEIKDVDYYTEVAVIPEQTKGYPGYDFNAGISNTSAWIMPGESVTLNLYYDLHEYTVTYIYSSTVDGVTMPALPISQTYKFGETVQVASNNITIAEAPEYVFNGWYRQGDAQEIALDSFDMPAADVVLYGYFTIAEYYLTVEWSKEDGVYHGGKFSWDCVTLQYIHDASTAGWSTVPYVKCVVKNKGTKPVNLDFIAKADRWADYLSSNPFQNIPTVRLEGGAEYTFEFKSDVELVWDYDALNDAAAQAVINGLGDTEEANTFELSITKAE